MKRYTFDEAQKRIVWFAKSQKHKARPNAPRGFQNREVNISMAYIDGTWLMTERVAYKGFLQEPRYTYFFEYRIEDGRYVYPAGTMKQMDEDGIEHDQLFEASEAEFDYLLPPGCVSQDDGYGGPFYVTSNDIDVATRCAIEYDFNRRSVAHERTIPQKLLEQLAEDKRWDSTNECWLCEEEEDDEED